MKKMFILFILILCAFAFAGTVEDRESDLKPIDKISNSTFNQKVYLPLEEKVVIKDAFGLTTTAEVTLLTPKHHLVGAGYQKVAEFEINSNINDSDFLKKMYFYDLQKDSKPLSRNFDIREEVQYQETVPITEWICDDSNKSCQETITGKKTIDKIRYALYSEKSITTGTKKLSIWTNVEVGDSVEWIPDIFGVAVQEWASWDYSLNAGILDYWNFEEASGNLLDQVGFEDNLTNSGGYIQQIPGKINFAYNYNGTTGRSSKSGTTSITNGNNPITISGWVQFRTTGGGFFYTGTNSSNRDWRLGLTPTGVMFQTFGAPCDDGNIFLPNTWYMVTGVYDGSTQKIYANGVLKKTCSYGSSNYANDNMFMTGTSYYDGNLDEFGIWGRALTQTEITTLYGGGTGMTYLPTPRTAITFNVYRKNTVTNLGTVDLDSNNNTLDLTNQNSPFSTIYVDQNTGADANFSRTGYDSNYQILYFDSNKTQTIFLSDTHAPIVGQTILTGFTINGTGIEGTGEIAATATDSGSGINSVTCEYTIDNTNWLPATDFNGTYCRKTGYVIPIAGNFTFNIRVRDDANNMGTGTPTITYHAGKKITIRIKDENTFLDLNGVTLDFNSTTFTINTIQEFETIDLNNGQRYTMTFSKTGYGTRYYQFDLNSLTDLDINFLLLPSTMGAALDYRIYDSNGSVLSPLSYFQMNRPDMGNYTIGRRLTTTAAYTTIFTNIVDQNYTQYVDNNSPYSMVTLTILRPINNISFLPITEQWNVEVTGPGSGFDTNLTTSHTVYLLPNLVLPYVLNISDANGNYSRRSYIEQFTGNPLTATLQPYLTPIGAATQRTLKTLNYTTNQTYPFVTIIIRAKDNNGVLYILESVITDSTGTASAYLTDGEDYYLLVNGNVNYFITPNSEIPVYYIYLNTFSLPDSNILAGTLTPTNDLNQVRWSFFGVRNSIFNVCTSDDTCFPSALLAMILILILIVCVTASGYQNFIGVKGLSAFTFVLLTIFFGITWIPLFMYVFLGAMAGILMVMVQ